MIVGRRREPPHAAVPTAPRSRLRRTTRSLLGLAVLAGLGVAAAAPADARPVDRTGGPATKSSTIQMVPVDTADPVLNFNEQVTFSVSTTVTDRPMVRLYCYQNGAEVYWSSAGFFPDYPWPWARDFTLRSDYWTGARPTARPPSTTRQATTSSRSSATTASTSSAELVSRP